jgi:metal-dependent hydrolase (beta-lactamase superfamily II)
MQTVSMATEDDADAARVWLREHGFDVVVERRDLRDLLVDTGQAGTASMNWTHWADLVAVDRPDEVVAPNYGAGKSEAEAVVSARRRFGSEQT